MPARVNLDLDTLRTLCVAHDLGGLTAAADEYREASLGSSVHFGRYSVDPVKHTISFAIERSTFPNWDQTTQIRAYEMKGSDSHRFPTRTWRLRDAR
jgi:hypothetical protein